MNDPILDRDLVVKYYPNAQVKLVYIEGSGDVGPSLWDYKILNGATELTRGYVSSDQAWKELADKIRKGR